MAQDAKENIHFHAQIRPSNGEAAQVQKIANAFMINVSESGITRSRANSV
jgi:hypothetical protein